MTSPAALPETPLAFSQPDRPCSSTLRTPRATELALPILHIVCSQLVFPSLVLPTLRSQLGTLSLVLGIAQIAIFDGSAVRASGFFQGYSWLTGLVVMQVSLGGLLVALVMK